MKKVLVTAKTSYIGTSFCEYVIRRYPGIKTECISLRDGSWRGVDFSSYDAVFHVAGIAHADVGSVDFKKQQEYYAVNADLAVEVAEKAKREGVNQFIFMSSMIIYGDAARIDADTEPSPANFYGDSKWQGDKGVRQLEGTGFKVAVIRPPMIYGPGSKGNYPLLAKLARLSPVFPVYENTRSMLYIDNLCELICALIESGRGGIFFPQNGEYSDTSKLVGLIAEARGSRLIMTKLLTPFVKLALKMPGKISALAGKAFGDSYYDMSISDCDGIDYRRFTLEESILRTESGLTRNKKAGKKPDGKKHILVVTQYFYPETFRINDMVKEWVKRGYRVTVLTGIPNYPMGKTFEGYGLFKRRREVYHGADVIRIPLVPRGTGNFGMILNYLSFALSGRIWAGRNAIAADIVFTCEVSPMTQALVGCWYSRIHGVPHYLYVQDLWPDNVETITGIHSPLLLKPIDRMVDYIYRNSEEIFTTSPSFVREIRQRKKKVPGAKVHFWPQYAEEFYRPHDAALVRRVASKKNIEAVKMIPEDSAFYIAFTGNIGLAQGLDILPRAARIIKDRYEGAMESSAGAEGAPKIRFVMVGDGRYQQQLEDDIEQAGVSDMFIMIPRQQAEVIPGILACCDAAFLSFEDNELWTKTIPAKLQSYMACAMPIIASARGETRRIIDEADCGICCPLGDETALADAACELAAAGEEKLAAWGSNGRSYLVKHFSKKTLMDEMDRFFEDAY